MVRIQLSNTTVTDDLCDVVIENPEKVITNFKSIVKNNHSKEGLGLISLQ